STTVTETAPAGQPAPLEVEFLSARPDVVTGGQVLIGVAAGNDTISVEVNGAALDDVAAPVDGRYEVLVTGLVDGDNEVTVRAADAETTKTVTNHPITGPVFSGPHLPLPVCTTEALGLGPALDDDCSADTVVSWWYFDDAGAAHALDDPQSLPADVGTTPNGDPFVIRREQGTINRSVYWIDVLDPAPSPDGWNRDAWNERLVYEFGGGCGTTWTQGFRFTNDPSPEVLGAGYAVATATFNTFQVACNDVLSAETASMVKEHFVESYGVPNFTIGQGGSGGAIQQYLIAQNYPGILDAINPTVPFPDALSISGGVLDCGLLQNLYRQPEAQDWDDAVRAAINGHLTAATCDSWELTFVPINRATDGCGLGLLRAAQSAFSTLPDEFPTFDQSLVYDPVDNPDGLRCTAWDTNRNILDDLEPGEPAPSVYDNTGVQYGLAGLNAGTVSIEQFLAVNERIGGFDPDGGFVAERNAADPAVVQRAYETGRIIDGSGDLLTMPIITVDFWSDEGGDIHDRVRAFAVRDRLDAAAGGEAPGHMIWTRGQPGGGSLLDSLQGEAPAEGRSGLEVLDEWLTAMAADDSGDDAVTVLERHRPNDAIDNCHDADGTVVRGIDLYDQRGPCTDPFPISGTPRTVAGQERVENVVKCSLQSIDDAIVAGMYEVDFDDAQRARLDTAFPEGVCDYSVPGVGQVPPTGTWQRF
ncbi:MAG: DUF6351 family protein, partial [Acidimicrobiia bacterium]|nr:DUF6351 family protein [Acidimicrobiia bacterium]